MDTGPAAEGPGRFTQDTTVGSTLWTGVEEASGGALTHRYSSVKYHPHHLRRNKFIKSIYLKEFPCVNVVERQ